MFLTELIMQEMLLSPKQEIKIKNLIQMGFILYYNLSNYLSYTFTIITTLSNKLCTNKV